METSMNTLTIHTIETAPEASKESLRQLALDLGFVPNVFGAIADAPSALAAFMALNTHFAASSFSQQERQIIQLATSTENECVYCVAGHTAFAYQMEMPQDTINAMRNKKPLPDTRLQALNSLTRHLLNTKGRVSKAELDKFYGAGFSRPQLLELIMGICVKVFSNYTSNALSIPLDEAFKEHAWQRPSES